MTKRRKSLPVAAVGAVDRSIWPDLRRPAPSVKAAASSEARTAEGGNAYTYSFLLVSFWPRSGVQAAGRGIAPSPSQIAGSPVRPSRPVAVKISPSRLASSRHLVSALSTAYAECEALTGETSGSETGTQYATLHSNGQAVKTVA